MLEKGKIVRILSGSFEGKCGTVLSKCEHLREWWIVSVKGYSIALPDKQLELIER